MKKLWLIILLGIILRVFLSFATFHPDTKVFDIAGRVVASGNILSVYEHSSPEAIFNYPPLIYLFQGIFHVLPFEGYGFAKLPYLIFDLLTVLVFLKLFPSANMAKWAVIFWMFNPINLYATYMMGQFDIIPTFFTLLSFYFVSKSKLSLAALSLGAGIAFKIYPVFLLIPLALLGRTYWDKIKLVILGILPYILSVLPYIQSSNFRTNALFASQSSKSLYAAIPVSGGESILLFPAFLLLFYLFVRVMKIDKENLWKFYLIPLLLFFIFTHFHPQWLIWITPFIILDLIINKFRNLLPVSLIFGSWLASLFFFDSSLTVGLFAPLFPILQNTPDIWTLLNINPDYNSSRSILQTVFAGSALFLLFYHFLDKENG